MPDHDAFGRPIGDAPTGWGPRPSSGGSPSPSRSPSPGGPRRRRPFWLVFVLLDLVILLGVGAYLAVSGGDDEGSGSALIGGGPGSAPEGGGDPATGDASLLGPRGARDVVGRVRAAARPGERVTSLTLRADRASIRLSDGVRERWLTIDDDGDLRELSTSTSASGHGVAPSRIDPAAVERIVAAVRRGLGPSSTGAVDYVTLTGAREEGDPPEWLAFLTQESARESQERLWRADADGRHVVRGDGAPAPEAGEAGPARLPTGVAGRSLVRAANLRQAVAAVRRLAPSGSLVTSLHVDPLRVLVTTRRRWVERRFTVNAALGVTEDATSETTRRNGTRFGAIDAAAPQRAIDRISRRTGASAAARLGYVLLQARDPTFRQTTDAWGVYLAGGDPSRRYWRASSDGRRVGRPGTPGAP